MAGPGMITDYLAALSAQLAAPVVEELADGLDQTAQRYLDQGLAPEAAAAAAIAEFGTPEVILASFTRLSPALGRPRAGCWPPDPSSAGAGRQR